ncbi:MAG: hypothetical protein KDB69_03045 [Acidimicrobiia bacterium]|nr:hypothetical protein [Acidimicrobiia bacterium]
MTDRWEPVRMLEVRPEIDSRYRVEKEVGAEDPLELVGVTYPTDRQADVVAARCFVEEYAMVGWQADDIATLFTLPEYAALYRLFSMYGFEFVHEAIVSVFPGQRRA